MRNIGFDLHGVINTDVEGFKKTYKQLKTVLPATQVFVISGPPIDMVIDELLSLGLIEGEHYDKAFSVVTYLKENGVKLWKGKEGSYWAENEEWWDSKGKICKENDVALLYDDSDGYQKGCQDRGTTFAKYKPGIFKTLCTFNCLLALGEVVLTDSVPTAAITQLE